MVRGFILPLVLSGQYKQEKQKQSYFVHVGPYPLTTQRVHNSGTQNGHSFEGVVSMAGIAMVRGWPVMAPIKQKQQSESRLEDTCE